PACILNQIETDSGIPLDSNKFRNALVENEDLDRRHAAPPMASITGAGFVVSFKLAWSCRLPKP
ncbi:MAG: hypothetical protein ACRED2_10665, partial [Methylocella sp.]